MASAENLPTLDCAVVGVGDLGTSLCRKILETTDWKVTGVTRSTTRHEEIRRSMPSDHLHRFTLTTRGEMPSDQKYTNVVFCAPPLGPEDYAEVITDAGENIWVGNKGGGIFCLTSSGGVYATESDVVTEDTPIDEITPRVERLMKGENACSKLGGFSLRLGALYKLERGAHTLYLQSGYDEIPGNKHGVVNLLHYDDAAAACLAAIKAGPVVCQNKVFLISDANPLTRKKICDIALKCPRFESCQMPTFVDDKNLPGKRYDGSASNAALDWKPRFPSFESFMEKYILQ